MTKPGNSKPGRSKYGSQISVACGATTFWRLGMKTDRIGIPVGMFADPAFPSPRVAIFVPSKHPWVTIPDGIPQPDAHSPSFYAKE